MRPEPVYKTIGTIIRGRRRRLEWPQETLAARLGISRATLANIETGRQRVLVHQLYAFAEVLQLKPSDLLPPTGESQPAADMTKLPIQGDVNPEQREQIARLIGSQPAPPKAKEKIDAKTAKRAPGSSRPETAR
jgi:transcriptional regulator with XRE-family HTH domain